MNSNDPAPESGPAAALSATHNHRLWAIATGLPLMVAILVAAIIAGQSPRARVLNDSELRANGAYMFESPQTLPPFSLVDHHGAAFDRSRLQGRWTLVFFGFTHCPGHLPHHPGGSGAFDEKTGRPAGGGHPGGAGDGGPGTG